LGQVIDAYFDKNARGSSVSTLTPTLFISPNTIEVGALAGTGIVRFTYTPQLTVKRRIKVTLDELKKIEKVACKVAYTEDKPISGRGKR
jgi:hypothetical protein